MIKDTEDTVETIYTTYKTEDVEQGASGPGQECTSGDLQLRGHSSHPEDEFIYYRNTLLIVPMKTSSIHPIGFLEVRKQVFCAKIKIPSTAETAGGLINEMRKKVAAGKKDRCGREVC